MRFEWDYEKEKTNIRKHDIDFDFATLVFWDRLRLEEFDGRENPNEDRWKTIGLASINVLVVIYTIRDKNGEVFRLISARKATKNEERKYYQP